MFLNGQLTAGLYPVTAALTNETVTASKYSSVQALAASSNRSGGYCTIPSDVDALELPTMSQAANFSAAELLRDGSRIEIRALRPSDRAAFLLAVDHTSFRSLYRRFFGIKRGFSEKEISHFLNVDFVNHVALVAVRNEDSREIIVGGGRYIVVGPGTAELAFTIVDEYQGKGLGRALLRDLVALARNAGLKELIAEVLPDNVAMLKVFENSGLSVSTAREAGVIRASLRLF
jgi:RimJ/RimL family protein N-acetyltransferase